MLAVICGHQASPEGRYADAERDFQRAVELSPHDAYAHLNLAWALVRQGGPSELTEASKQCRASLKLDPTAAQACGCLGVIAYRQGKIRESELQFLRSIEMDRTRGFHVDLAALYIAVSRFEEAAAQLTEALKIDGNDAQAHLALGNLYLQTERGKDALREFRLAMTLDPNHQDPPRALALALAELGQLTDAEKILRSALGTIDQSRRRSLHLALGQVLTMLGDECGESIYFEAALKEIAAAIRLSARRADSHFQAGVVRFKLNDHEGALKSFRRALKLDKSYVEADLNAQRLQAMLRSNAKKRTSEGWEATRWQCSCC